MTGEGGYGGTRMSVKSNDGGGGGYGTRMSVKSNDGGGGGYGTRMSVKSNDGGGGGAIQRGQLLCYKYHCCLVFFLVLYGGSGSYGRDRSVCDTIHAE